MDTIYALATARGKAGLAVVRISGRAAVEALALIGGPVPAARRMALRRLTWDGVVLDEALVAVFHGPASFTGEDVVELHLHGGGAVVAAVLRVLGGLPGLRMAEPGEFTRRALENGRIGLEEVEGLSDLIDAETEAQRRQAMEAMQGALGARVEAWRGDLVRAEALVAAGIDFADEDVPDNLRPEVSGLVAQLLRAVEAELAGLSQAERLRDGFEVAIIGVPNSGKSTLLNALAGREAALTSDVAGTTRDVIEVRMDLRGLPVTFLDTAGLRDTEDRVEAMGIARARARAGAADLRVLLVEAEGQADGVELGAEDIVLRSKADLGVGDISGLTGAGIEGLIDRVCAILSRRVARIGAASRERHRAALARAQASLMSALARLEQDAWADGAGAELVAEDLRQVHVALQGLVGKVDVEAVLGEIFSRFCIGK